MYKSINNNNEKGGDTITRLKILRIKAGLTQQEIAKRLEVSQGAVCWWEKGVNKPLAKYQRELAKMFGVTKEYLFPDEESGE